eukprot:TRINITY_DN12167_c0_g1_i1.p1 TRINITY_DN12167_c0_g1~~TRINITY_DN12167_c0_g1_i1.p1  ORF type:complete len:498 (+),score=155.78 TRINITY_DN12167_c0_g1_i1:68-1495(+)
MAGARPRRRRALWPAAACAALASLSLRAAAQSFNCSSCETMQAHPESGKLRCTCTVDASTALFDAEGVFHFETEECSREALITGTWRGEPVNETVNNVSSRIDLGTAFGCEVAVTLNRLAFSEAGMYFCPHLELCGSLAINKDLDQDAFCVDFHEDDECLAIESCGGCLSDPRCGWCNTTGHCLLRSAANPAVDKCATCGGAFLEGEAMAAHCPPPPPPAEEDDGLDTGVRFISADPPAEGHCGTRQDRGSCMGAGCTWHSESGECTHVSPAPTPLPGLVDWPFGGDEGTPAPTFAAGDLLRWRGGLRGGAREQPESDQDPDKFSAYTGRAGAGDVGGVVILALLSAGAIGACVFFGVRARRAYDGRKVLPSARQPHLMSPADTSTPRRSQQSQELQGDAPPGLNGARAPPSAVSGVVTGSPAHGYVGGVVVTGTPVGTFGTPAASPRQVAPPPSVDSLVLASVGRQSMEGPAEI